MNLTPGQVDQISELSNEWSFFWDKQRAMWIAAEDSPDGEQVEAPDLDAVLALLCDRLTMRKSATQCAWVTATQTVHIWVPGLCSRTELPETEIATHSESAGRRSRGQRKYVAASLRYLEASPG